MELRAQCGPQLRIETGKRLVEQEDPRLTHESPGQRHSLLFASGELVWIATAEGPDSHHVQRPLSTRRAFSPRHPRGSQHESEVLSDRQVRPEGEILKDKPQASFVWRDEIATCSGDV